MKQKATIFLLLITSLVFTSCLVSRDYISNITKNSALSYEKTNRILIATSDKLSLSSFKKTFEKNYELDIDFVNEYSSELANELMNNNVFTKVALDNEVNKWNVLTNGINAANLIEVDSLVANTNADYLITIDNYNISNRFVTSYSGGGMNGGFGHQTSTEYCMVSAGVKVYDLKTREIVVSFETTGESSVFMFDFTKTFKKAKERSITHIVNYLKTGKVKYSQY